MEEKDLNRLKEIVGQYKKIYDEISEIEERLKTITSEKDILVKQLLDMRDDEHVLISDLMEKYPGIDIQTIIDTTILSLNI